MKVRTIAKLELGLHEWAAEQAAKEKITPGELIDRALERERRRVMGERPLDNGTRKVGKRGAAARLNAGELATSELAKVARTTPAVLHRLERMGCIAPTKAGGQGHVSVWDEAAVPMVVVLARLLEVGAGLPAERFLEAAGYLRDQPRTFYNPLRFLVAGMNHETRVVGGTHLADALRAWREAVVVVELTDAGRVADTHVGGEPIAG